MPGDAEKLGDEIREILLKKLTEDLRETGSMYGRKDDPGFGAPADDHPYPGTHPVQPEMSPGEKIRQLKNELAAEKLNSKLKDARIFDLEQENQKLRDEIDNLKSGINIFEE